MSLPITAMDVVKRPKIKAGWRREQILALQLAGLTQEQIAIRLGVDRRTIVRDLRVMRPSTEAVVDMLSRAQKRIRETFPVEARVDNYVALAKNANNEAVRQGCTQRLDDLDNIVTERERIRMKSQEQPQSAPMFVLPPGAAVSVTVNQMIDQRNTTGSSEVLDNSAMENKSNGINATGTT